MGIPGQRLSAYLANMTDVPDTYETRKATTRGTAMRCTGCSLRPAVNAGLTRSSSRLSVGNQPGSRSDPAGWLTQSLWLGVTALSREESSAGADQWLVQGTS